VNDGPHGPVLQKGRTMLRTHRVPELQFIIGPSGRIARSFESTARRFRLRWLLPNYSDTKKVLSPEHCRNAWDVLNRQMEERLSSMKSANYRWLSSYPYPGTEEVRSCAWKDMLVW